MVPLLDLARHATREKRRELLRTLADMFVTNGHDYSDRELILFADVISDLLDRVDIEARTDLADRIADSEHASVDLFRRLANDDILVAEPVLSRCGRLDDGTLVDIASRQSQEHLEAIARRPAVSAAVTDILVARGDVRVLRSVTGNLGAEISVQSFERIASHVEDDAEIQTAISYRGDMPVDLAERVLKILPEHQQARLLRLMAEDPEAADSLIGAADSKTRERRLEQARRRLQTKAMIAQVDDGQMDADAVLILLARENRHQNVAMVLARLGRIRERLAVSTLFKVDHQPLVILLRALDVSETCVAALADMRSRRLNLPDSMKRRMIVQWRAIDRETARKVMTMTRLRDAH